MSSPRGMLRHASESAWEKHLKGLLILQLTRLPQSPLHTSAVFQLAAVSAGFQGPPIPPNRTTIMYFARADT